MTKRTTDAEPQEETPLVDAEDLRVTLPTGERDEVDAVRGVTLSIGRGERVGLVGESGSGKSVTGRAIAGLLPENPRVRVTGSLRIDGAEMIGADAARWADVRRSRVGMIFQDPLTFLNPTMRVGAQVAESLPPAVRRNGAARREAVHDFLRQAGLDRAAQVARAYPHELSGGMRQRVLIAIAIAKKPELVLADEPTTALDATVQLRVLRTLDETVSELGTSLLLISHDMAVVAGMTDRLYVMYAGRIVESGPTRRLIDAPEHPYTRALLRSVRSLSDDGTELYSIPPELRAALREEADRAA